METVIGLGVLAAITLVIGMIYIAFAKAEEKRQKEEAADFQRRVEARNEQIRLRAERERLESYARREVVRPAAAKPRVKPAKPLVTRYEDSYRRDDNDDLMAASVAAVAIATAYEPNYTPYEEPTRSYDSGSSSNYD